MVQRVNFSIETNLGNVADPVLAQDAVTLNYLNNSATGFTLDTLGTFTNASVTAGNIVLTNAISAGTSTNSLVVQSTGTAGTEVAVQQFFNNRPLTQIYAFAGFTLQTFTVAANGSTAPGQVTLALNAQINFPAAIPAGTILQFATVNPAFTPIKDVVLGTNLTGTVGTNSFGRSTLTLNAMGGAAITGSAISIGESYVADNIGALVRTLTTDPTVNNISGTLTAISDFGLIAITSTPWPVPTPAGTSTQFLILEASDYSWSGCGSIQTVASGGSNALTQIAWIRKPTTAGATFTNARCWIVTNSVGSNWVGSSVADATSRNPNTTLTYPDLVLGSITQSSDSFGSNAANISVVPTINNQIALRVGSVGTINLWSSTVSPAIAAVTATTIVVDDEVLAPQLIGQYLWVNSTATQPNTVFVSSGAQTGVQYTLTVVGNPITAGFSINASNIFYSSNANPNRFTFVNPPQTEIIRLAQTNCVPSLNGLQGVATNLVAGTGIGISTSSPNITINNTAAGVSSSNFTSFVVNGGGLGGVVAFASTNSPGGNSACIGFGLEPADSQVDGGAISGVSYINTNAQAISPFQYGLLYPVATSYTDLEVLIYGWSYTCNFTTSVGTSTGVFTLDEYLFSRADSTAANPPDKNANIFPGFRINNISDDIQLIPLRNATLTVTGGPTNFSATVTGGIYSGVSNNYNHAVATTTVPFIPWQRIVGADINSVSNVVITAYGGARSLISLPGVGGAVPSLDQVLQIGSSSARSLSLTGTAVLSAPNLALSNAGANTITLRTPAAVTNSYAVTFPAASPSYGNTLVTTDAAGNTAWQPAGLELIRLVSTTNITPSGAQTVDGVAVALNDLVLLQNQTTTSQNGLYAVVLSGAWSKLTTYPSQSVFAQAGTANMNRTYTRNQTTAFEQWVFTGNASAGSGGTAGGSNLSYQWNNSGVLDGDGALFRDTTNNRVSALAPVDPSNVARLGDVQEAATGVQPVDPMNIPVNIAETNVVGTYVNNTGLGTATLTGTGTLTVAGRIPNIGDIVLLVNQTQPIQNGGYAVTVASQSLQIIFTTPQCFPQIATTVTFTFTGISGGSANFTMAFNASQQLASAASVRPANLDPSWNYQFTGGNTATLSSVNNSVRWTVNPTLTIDVVPGVTYQNGIPTQRTFNPLLPFVLTRLPSPVSYGELWVGNAPSSSNFGVQFFNTTVGTITIGTTPITFALFGVASPINNLQMVTAAGNTTNLGIGFQQTSGGTNAITLVGSQFLTANRQYQLMMSNYPAIAGTPLTCDPSGNLGFNAAIAIGNSASDNLTLSAGIISRSGTGTLTLLGGTGANDAVLLGSGGAGTLNYLRIASATSGNAPTIAVVGESGASLNIAAGPTGQVNIATNRGNNVAIIGGAAGASAVIAARGGDTNVSLDVRGAGVNGVNIGSNLANYVNITPNPAGAMPVIQAAGADTNIGLSVRAKGNGVLQLNTAGGGGISLGPITTATYTNPLYAAAGLNPGTADLTAGTQGQVLTSRGAGNTPAWAAVGASSIIPVYTYALLGDQTNPATPFTFNTTATFSQGTAFGSWTNSSTFNFTNTGIYLAIFSFNVISGSADISIVFNNNRVAGATGGGKQEITGIGNVTAVNQTLVVQNYVSAGFSGGQSNLTLIKLG